MVVNQCYDVSTAFLGNFIFFTGLKWRQYLLILESARKNFEFFLSKLSQKFSQKWYVVWCSLKHFFLPPTPTSHNHRFHGVTSGFTRLNMKSNMFVVA